MAPQSIDRCGVALPCGWRAICLPLWEDAWRALKYKRRDGKQAVIMTIQSVRQQHSVRVEQSAVEALRRRLT